VSYPEYPEAPPERRVRLGRRTFLSASTASVAGLVIAGCGDDDGGGSAQSTPTPQATQGQGPGVAIDFSEGDVAIVNFAYALEQLEAAFYAMVNENPASGLTDDGRRTLEDIGAHEIVHREFFKAALGENAIPELEVNFADIDFGSADAVLQTAQTFEDLGVSAYNGAAQFLTGHGALGLVPLQAAGEIVSVEARHASAIRTLLQGDSSGQFAPSAFDEALLPGEVLQMAAPFVKTKIELRNAPTQPAS